LLLFTLLPLAASAGGLRAQDLVEPDWFVEGDQDFGYFGYDVDGAGDVNGDGYDDVIIGWDYYSGDFPRQGVALVYHGGPSGLSQTPDWRYEGCCDEASLGASVAGAGDVNNDGYDDVLIWDGHMGPHGYGTVVLFLGGASGLSSSPAWTGAPIGKGHGRYGWSMAAAGDVNGDGYDDILIGDPNYDDARHPGIEGRLYLYFGGKHGISPRRPLTLEGVARFSLGLAGAGDVNGDGYDDVVVGESQYNEASGRALVFLGFAGGLKRTPAWTFSPVDARLSNFGHTVSGAGDINGDGYGDILVGQPYFTGGGVLCFNPVGGRAFVFHGGPDGPESEPALVIEEPFCGCEAFGFGRSLAGAGDVNGDGTSDVVVGWWSETHNGYDRGTGFIHLGGESGLGEAPGRFFVDPDGGVPNGGSVAGAGDVNGDGLDDVIVSTPSHSSSQCEYAGAVSLFLGRASASTTPAEPQTGVVRLSNYPNPFNPTTTIRFELEYRTNVRIDVFDVRGRLVDTLADRVFSAGDHEASWDGVDARGARAASGVYFVRLTAQGRVLTRRMLLLK